MNWIFATFALFAALTMQEIPPPLEPGQNMAVFEQGISPTPMYEGVTRWEDETGNAYIRFDLSTLPPTAAIEAAQLALYHDGWSVHDVTAEAQAWATFRTDEALTLHMPDGSAHRPRLTLTFTLSGARTCRPQPAAQNGAIAPFPDTTSGIHVFNDQIDVDFLTDAQAEFAATHYAGAQKTTLSGTQRLRAYNPDFVALHYRLGLGLGYRAAEAGCQPTGEYLHHLRGDEWVRDWPEGTLPESWFYHYDGERLYWCAWGWYMMNTDHPGWRQWWLDGVLREMQIGQYDGLFADSVTVPNYLGSDDWRPALPPYDEAFEAQWTRRINAWMDWANAALGSEYALIVNAGPLVVSRETTDYSRADGVMVEGFAGWGEYERFELGDWELQMNRIQRLVEQGRVVILQSTIAEPEERLWTLANYLLVKGDRTYINLEVSQNVEWFPEYDIPIGAPLGSMAAADSLYARDFEGGRVLVNPDPAGRPIAFSLDAPMHRITGATGGGDVPEDAGIADWGVTTTEVIEVTVAPGQAAILLNAPVSEAPPTEEAQPAPASTAGGLEAVHRSGQTFLTWPEVNDDLSITYSVYRHTAPIDANTLNEAALLAELPQGTGIYWTERGRFAPNGEDHSAYRSLQNYVIEDLGPELPDGTGLFVWTAQEDAEAYYAVASSDGALFAAAGPISEQMSTPAPVLVWQSEDGHSRVYTQFMDYAAYNPTFDAPREGNGFHALPEWEALSQIRSQQYAYNYWVGLPTPETCGGAVPERLPLVLNIQGWGSRYSTFESTPWEWCAGMVWGDDPSQSWYFGFSAVHDYHSGEPVAEGPIVNYTEARVVKAVYDTIDILEAEADTPSVDTDRVYVFGHSMGGTGALMLAERYPQIFAAASASEPMMDFAASELFAPELEGKWGAPDLNLPVEIRGPAAGHLAEYNGTGVWDWENLGAQLYARRGDEMAFISIAHGTQDHVIDWQTVAQPAYTHFYAGARAFIGEIIAIDHTWLAFRDHPNWPFDLMTFRRDESLPALSGASGSLPAPPPGVGGYNLTLEWSSSWNDFAGPPVDTPAEWSIALRSLEGEQTVDVTPRRLQAFEVMPGEAYTWQNVQLSDDAVVQEGEVTADEDGLVTVQAFLVSESGNRLIIR